MYKRRLATQTNNDFTDTSIIRIRIHWFEQMLLALAAACLEVLSGGEDLTILGWQGCYSLGV